MHIATISNAEPYPVFAYVPIERENYFFDESQCLLHLPRWEKKFQNFKKYLFEYF